MSRQGWLESNAAYKARIEQEQQELAVEKAAMLTRHIDPATKTKKLKEYPQVELTSSALAAKAAQHALRASQIKEEQARRLREVSTARDEKVAKAKAEWDKQLAGLATAPFKFVGKDPEEIARLRKYRAAKLSPSSQEEEFVDLHQKKDEVLKRKIDADKAREAAHLEQLRIARAQRSEDLKNMAAKEDPAKFSVMYHTSKSVDAKKAVTAGVGFWSLDKRLADTKGVFADRLNTDRNSFVEAERANVAGRPRGLFAKQVAVEKAKERCVQEELAAFASRPKLGM